MENTQDGGSFLEKSCSQDVEEYCGWLNNEKRSLREEVMIPKAHCVDIDHASGPWTSQALNQALSMPDHCVAQAAIFQT